VDVEARAKLEEDKGWMVLATTVRAEGWGDADMLHASQAHNTPGAPGLRWRKPPAAIAPGWLEKPERMAALAMLTVVGVLVYRLLQRPVRLSLRPHD
jgi:hypothetical protein